MKKFYTLLVVLLVGFIGNAQNITIPNNWFNLFLFNASPANNYAENLQGSWTAVDTNSDGQISIAEANQISKLSIPGMFQITSLEGIENFGNLKYLNCTSNSLTSLNINGLTHLISVSCSSNPFTSISLTNCPALNSVSVANAQLTELDFSGLPILNYLNCGGNPNLTSINIKNGCPYFSGLVFPNTPNLHYICADESKIEAIQASITNYGNTNCFVNTYCTPEPGGSFYTIQGENRYDSDNNGCDIGDNYISNVKMSFFNNTSTAYLISNASGNYHFDVPQGTYTVSPIIENSNYFTVSPSTATVNFPLAASPYSQNFCVSANGNLNDLEIVIYPTTSARPGFDAKYKIIYKNKGTTIQNGLISFEFNDTIEDVVSANPLFISQSPNTLSWNFSNLLPFEMRTIDLCFHVNSTVETPAVNPGDIIQHTAAIIGADEETSNDNTSTATQNVVNSYDPNDKTCIEGALISSNMVGQYIHYIIRFENTGTANAENVIISDIIDTSKLDLNSLIPLSGSHSFETRIPTSNKVEFLFQGINLPFDDATNDGYVAFKIKTKPTLVVGDSFSNTANIYFDYNTPIVTNTATTTIQSLGNVDFDFNTVFTLAPVPAKSSLTLTAKQKTTISSISIYNTLGQLVQVITNPAETIDVSDLKTGSYFIKILSDNGTANGKFIKE